MDLKGAQVRALLLRHLANGGYPALEWSGLTLDVDPAGRRLVAAKVGDAPLDDARTYRVATNSFLAAGGDGFDAFREGKSLHRTGILIRDALADALAASSPLTPPAASRLVEVECVR
jgi:2',3'-cyclic-nucleotide 2'-phosphodiesterase (5'-nucleotidase family)